MKKMITSFIATASVLFSFSQNNVGIGTASPNNSAILDITSTSKGLLIPRMTTAQRTAIASPAKGLLVFDTDLSTFFFYNGSAWAQFNSNGNEGASQWITSGNNIYNSNTANVGLGTSSPTYKLDLVGRMRFQHTGGSVTAGAWFDGINQQTRSFIGTLDDNYVGIYGNGGAGWNLVMNVNNGNTGVGTSAPTARLDVNGSIRMRGESPAKGSSLVSKDANGNAVWQRACAFRVEGLVDFEDITRSANVTAKINFALIPMYNIGLTYNAGTSEFTAPVKGIYSLSVMLEAFKMDPSAKAGNLRMDLIRVRNGVQTVIGEYISGVYVPELETYQKEYVNNLSGDFQLEAGDIIWVRTFTGSSHTIYGGNIKAFFCGHLVTQIF